MGSVMRRGAARRGWKMTGRWVASGSAVAGLMVLALIPGCQTARKPSPSVRVARPAGPLIVAPTCANFTVSIYFEPGSATPGREADALLSAAASRARGCSITGVRVRGLADAPGSHEANLALSRARAASVSRALHRRGFNQVEFQVTAAGDEGATGAAAGANHSLRRLVEVQIDLGAP